MTNADRMKFIDQQYRDCANAFAADVARLIEKEVRLAVKEELDRLTRPAPRERSTELGPGRTRRPRAPAEASQGVSRRGRRGADGGERAAAQAAQPAPTPPPLFVHKRAKDGRIESLVRSRAEEEAEAARRANGSSGVNGSAEHRVAGANGASDADAAEQVTFPFAADAE